MSSSAKSPRRWSYVTYKGIRVTAAIIAGAREDVAVDGNTELDAAEGGGGVGEVAVAIIALNGGKGTVEHEFKVNVGELVEDATVEGVDENAVDSGAVFKGAPANIISGNSWDDFEFEGVAGYRVAVVIFTSVVKCVISAGDGN